MALFRGMKNGSKQRRAQKIRKGRTRDINEYQNTLGHPSEAITHATAHAEGVLLKGNFSPCEDCV